MVIYAITIIFIIITIAAIYKNNQPAYTESLTCNKIKFNEIVRVRKFNKNNSNVVDTTTILK
jgi:hypothetical protein